MCVCVLITMGVCVCVCVGHGVELPFVFHTVNLGGFNFTQAELQLADDMVQYWTNFAHYGDPNGAQGVINIIIYLSVIKVKRILFSEFSDWK